MYLVSSELFAHPLIFGNFIHDGMTFSSNLNLITYLKPFSSQGNLFNITTLLIFTLSTPNG